MKYMYVEGFAVQRLWEFSGDTKDWLLQTLFRQALIFRHFIVEENASLMYMSKVGKG